MAAAHDTFHPDFVQLRCGVEQPRLNPLLLWPWICNSFSTRALATQEALWGDQIWFWALVVFTAGVCFILLHQFHIEDGPFAILPAGPRWPISAPSQDRQFMGPWIDAMSNFGPWLEADAMQQGSCSKPNC